MTRMFAKVNEVASVELDSARLGRESYLTYALRRNAATLLAHGPERVVRRVVSVSGFDNVEMALGKGHGAIIATAHIGHGGAAAAYAVRCGIKVYTIRRQALRRYQKPHEVKIAFFGTEPIFMDWEEAPVAILKKGIGILRENNVLSYVADGLYGGNARPAKMFGREVSIRTGMIELARISGAPVIPAFASVDSRGIHLRYESALKIKGPDDVEAFPQRFADFYAAAITQSPASMNWQPFQRQLFSAERDGGRDWD